MPVEGRRAGFAGACLVLIAAVALAPVAASAAGPGRDPRAGASAKKAFKPLTRKQIIALIKRYSSSGPAGSPGARGPAGPQGAAGEKGPEGKAGSGATIDGVAAGGALTGTYPSPMLNVSGGDEGATACRNGEALTGLSIGAVLGCGPGVYESGANLGIGGYEGSAGDFNTAGGDEALTSDTTGSDNTASGAEALTSDTTGSGNTASGAGALNFDTTGSADSASGAVALNNDTTGSDNTASGYLALASDTSGSGNIAIGFEAGEPLSTGSDDIYIGNRGGGPGETETIKIGTQGTQTRAFLAGVSGVAPAGTTSQVVVDSSGQLGTTSSSRRFKRDIHPIGPQLRRLLELRPVSYRYRHGYVHGATPVQYGLIAEQVAKVFPNLVVDDGHGRPSAVAYQELPALLLAEARRQRHELRRQGAEIASLQRAVARLGAVRGR